MSIFEGTDEIIDRSLFGARSAKFRQVSAIPLLAACGLADWDGASLIRELYDHTVDRWQAVNKDSPRQASAENWRFTLNTKISERNDSAEKQVEKRIAILAEQGRLRKNEWANQIPVASGLLDQHADKKACVDLSKRMGPDSFDLIELKLAPTSGHALFAAMEALRYGLLYVFSRRLGRDLGYVPGGSGLLGARRIRLVALAPRSYYQRISPDLLQRLRDHLNTGLKAECLREGPTGLMMEFEFEQFREPFHWPSTDDDLIAALEQRHSVLEPANQTSKL
jgi:hypothetical protein